MEAIASYLFEPIASRATMFGFVICLATLFGVVILLQVRLTELQENTARPLPSQTSRRRRTSRQNQS